MWFGLTALYTEQKYSSLCVLSLYKTSTRGFLDGDGWSWCCHSISMTLTVAAKKIHGVMSNVRSGQVGIPLTCFPHFKPLCSVAYIHLQ